MTLDNINYIYAAKERRASMLNEADFWGKIGVSKSTGIKYERGLTPMPEHVKIALVVCYGPMPYKIIAQLRNETYVYTPAKRGPKAADAAPAEDLDTAEGGAA